ncbi:hypothetical protein [Aurantimonas marina]|uniref:hypothetical protein n=1 Tax=Aurantimonas marina TaxID=2780508 RepID=UPI0019D1E259|nr:hypothetical protein [Aurantimonas marina]
MNWNYPKQSFANAEADRDISTLPIAALRRRANAEALPAKKMTATGQFWRPAAVFPEPKR